MATGFARKGRQRLRFLICAAWTPLVVLVLAGADPAAARTATSQISSPIATRGALSRLQVNPLLQQGPKLLGRSSEFSDAGWFGSEVALSANGSTALISGGGAIPLVWVFTRSGSIWTQRQTLCSSNGQACFGGSAALSADGGTALIGGPGDSNGRGAVWVFAQHLAKPPVTKITQVKISRQQHWAKFSFKAPGAKGFECALMKQPDKTAHFSRCKSPKTCTHVRPGTYIFEVRALSAAGAGPIVGRQFKI